MDVIGVAIGGIPEKFSGRDVNNSAGNNLWAGKPERHIAEILYGYRDGEIVEQQLQDGRVAATITYDQDYLPVAAKLFGREKSDRSFRRALEVMRQDIANKLLALKPRDVRFKPALPRKENVVVGEHSDQEDPAYVHRPGLEAILEHDAPDRPNVALLRGDAGVGKSTLARRAARELCRANPGATAAVILAHTDELLAETLSESLAAAEASPPGTDIYSLRRAFKALLGSDKAPIITVLDNVEEQQLLDALLPERPYGRVVVTSRKRLTFAGRSTAIDVGNMLPDEAASMIGLRVPGLSREGIAQLADALDRRPLAIEHGCSCLADAPYNGDVDVFCDALSRNITAVLDSYGDEDDVTLVAIYRMTIEQLEHQPSALLLLDIIAVLGPIVPPDTVLPIIWPSSGVDNAAPLKTEDQAVLHKAMRILEGRSLIQPRGQATIMHLLTQKIFAALRKSKAVEIASQAERCLSNRLDIPAWRGGGPLPSGWPTIAPIIVRILQTVIDNGGSRGWHSYDDHLFAVQLREYRQRGVITPELRDAAGLFVVKSLERGDVSRALFRETLELGYLDSGRAIKGPATLRDVRKLYDDSFVFEMIFREDSHPVVREYDYSDLEATVQRLTLIAKKAGDQLQEARISYAVGVLFFQLSHWRPAEEWWLKSCALYQELAEARTEYIPYVVECFRRLMDLSMRRKRHRNADRYMERGFALLQEGTRRKIAGTVLPTEIVLARRFEHSVTRWRLENCLGSGWLWPKDPVATFASVRQNLLGLMEIYENVSMWNLLNEAHFDFCRLTASKDPDRALDLLRKLSAMCRQQRRGMTVMLCDLTILKVELLRAGAMSRRQMRTVSAKSERLARALLHKYHSPFWRADALCVALSAAMLADANGPDVERLIELASSSANVVDRLDKVRSAVHVGRGLTPLVLLSE